MRKTLGVSLLVMLLTCSAHAGIIPNGKDEPPPPPPTATEESTEQDGNGTPDGVTTEAVLNLLGGLLSLL